MRYAESFGVGREDFPAPNLSGLPSFDPKWLLRCLQAGRQGRGRTSSLTQRTRSTICANQIHTARSETGSRSRIPARSCTMVQKGRGAKRASQEGDDRGQSASVVISIAKKYRIPACIFRRSDSGKAIRPWMKARRQIRVSSRHTSSRPTHLCGSGKGDQPAPSPTRPAPSAPGHIDRDDQQDSLRTSRPDAARDPGASRTPEELPRKASPYRWRSAQRYSRSPRRQSLSRRRSGDGGRFRILGDFSSRTKNCRSCRSFPPSSRNSARDHDPGASASLTPLRGG